MKYFNQWPNEWHKSAHRDCLSRKKNVDDRQRNEWQLRLFFLNPTTAEEELLNRFPFKRCRRARKQSRNRVIRRLAGGGAGRAVSITVGGRRDIGVQLGGWRVWLLSPRTPKGYLTHLLGPSHASLLPSSEMNKRFNINSHYKLQLTTCSPMIILQDHNSLVISLVKFTPFQHYWFTMWSILYKRIKNTEYCFLRSFTVCL